MLLKTLPFLLHTLLSCCFMIPLPTPSPFSPLPPLCEDHRPPPREGAENWLGRVRAACACVDQPPVTAAAVPDKDPRWTPGTEQGRRLEGQADSSASCRNVCLQTRVFAPRMPRAPRSPTLSCHWTLLYENSHHLVPSLWAPSVLRCNVTAKRQWKEKVKCLPGPRGSRGTLRLLRSAVYTSRGSRASAWERREGAVGARQLWGGLRPCAGVDTARPSATALPWSLSGRPTPSPQASQHQLERWPGPPRGLREKRRLRRGREGGCSPPRPGSGLGGWRAATAASRTWRPSSRHQLRTGLRQGLGTWLPGRGGGGAGCRAVGGTQATGPRCWPSCFLASCSSGDRNSQALHGPRGRRASGCRAALSPAPEAPQSWSPVGFHLSTTGACPQPTRHPPYAPARKQLLVTCVLRPGPHMDAESLDLPRPQEVCLEEGAPGAGPHSATRAGGTSQLGSRGGRRGRPRPVRTDTG